MGEEFRQVLGDGRFEVLRLLGEGGQGRTFLARDLVGSGGDVVVKELLLGRVGDWKSIELFEREGKALKNVRHAQVPAYVDAFVGADDGRFYLVQAFVDGQDLQARIDDGGLMNEGAAVDFLEQMLGVLGYLHGLSPPVIHRDLKPSNVMQRADGTYVLIDFGAVQSVMSDRVGGSTVVGTTGYMAPEQLMGRAVASSDLYSLAATVVHAVVGMRPSDMPMRRLRLDFRELAGLSDGLSDVLERMLAPEMGDRFGSAGEVLAALDGLRLGQELDRPVLGDEGKEEYRPSKKMVMLLGSNPSDRRLCGARIEEGKLVIDVRTRTSSARGMRLWWIGLMLAVCVVGLSGFLGIVWITVAIFVGFLLALVTSWRRLHARASHEVLKMGREGIEILKYGFDATLLWEKALTYGEIDRVYVDFVGRHRVEGRHGGALKEFRGMQSHGLVWLTFGGERYLFGNEALGRLQQVLGGSVDLKEFEWMNELIRTYWWEGVTDKGEQKDKAEAVALDFGVREVKEARVDAGR